MAMYDLPHDFGARGQQGTMWGTRAFKRTWRARMRNEMKPPIVQTVHGIRILDVDPKPVTPAKVRMRVRRIYYVYDGCDHFSLTHTFDRRVARKLVRRLQKKMHPAYFKTGTAGVAK